MTIVTSNSMITYKKPSGGWNAEQLSGYIKNSNTGLNIIDPERILSIEAQKRITSIINSVKDLRILFILTSKIHQKYWDYKNNEIDGLKFLHDVKFTELSSQFNRDDYLIIFYSLLDESAEWIIRKKASKHIGEAVCRDIAANVRRDLKIYDTDKTFVDMFQSIKDAQDYSETLTRIISWSWAVLMLTFIFGFLNKERKEHLLRYRLSLIKQHDAKKINLEDLAEGTCVVCLESLYSTVDISKVQKIKPSRVSFITIDEKPVLNRSNEEEKAPYPQHFVDINTSEFRECGHKFHTECISLLLNEQKECPLHVEKQKAEDGLSKSSLKHILFEIQVRALKCWFSIEQIHFYYNNDRLPSLMDVLWGKGKIVNLKLF